MKHRGSSNSSGEAPPHKPCLKKSLKQRLAANCEKKAAVKMRARFAKHLAAITTVDVRAGRPSISHVGPPAREFRLDQATTGGRTFFETVADKQAEDLFRAAGIENGTWSDEAEPAARLLATKLRYGAETADTFPTLASALHMRDVRTRVTGAIWQLHDELDHLPRSVFTLIPRGYWLTPEELEAWDLAKTKEALRSALNRAGARDADGALIVFLHGEYDEATDRYQLHWHGWAAGGMIDVVRCLRKQKAFISTKEARAQDFDGVRNRVVVSRKPILNGAYRLSYMMQSFWPSRATGVRTETATSKGGRFRVRGKRRLPEPQHSQLLLWLHQWRLEDISLLMKMNVVDGRLSLNSDQSPYTNGVR